MGLCWGGGLLRLLGVALLLLAVGCSGAFSHSLRYFYMATSEPVQGMPQFIAVGYVDDQSFVKYDSDTKRVLPQVPWIEKAEKDDPQYWERNTYSLQSSEHVFRASLEILRGRYNQSRGEFHILQGMYGCEVGPDGRFSGGHMQNAYDGEDFLTLDRETVTWTARAPQAEETKRRWETELHNPPYYKSYLEETCVEWLQRYLDYGNETLQRTEQRTVRVSRKKGHDGRETLFCQLYGFYSKEIEVTWRKDGEVWHQDTFTGGVVPNSDGTYHTWLSIDVDPKERNRYRCHVEHGGLPEPLDLACKDPVSILRLIVGVIDGFLAALSSSVSILRLIVGVVDGFLAAILLGAMGVALYMTGLRVADRRRHGPPRVQRRGRPRRARQPLRSSSSSRESVHEVHGEGPSSAVPTQPPPRAESVTIQSGGTAEGAATEEQEEAEASKGPVVIASSAEPALVHHRAAAPENNGGADIAPNGST